MDLNKPRIIDQPEPCFVRMTLVKHGPPVAARIFRRLGMLVAEINGQPASVDRVWTSGELITRDEWQALQNSSPEGADMPVDFRSMKPSF